MFARYGAAWHISSWLGFAKQCPAWRSRAEQGLSTAGSAPSLVLFPALIALMAGRGTAKQCSARLCLAWQGLKTSVGSIACGGPKCGFTKPGQAGALQRFALLGAPLHCVAQARADNSLKHLNGCLGMR